MASSTTSPIDSAASNQDIPIKDLTHQSSPSWSTFGDEQMEESMLQDLHCCAKHPIPNQSAVARDIGHEVYRQGALYENGAWRCRTSTFASIAIEGNLIVGVLDTMWFVYELNPGWEQEVVKSLECVNVTDLFCCGNSDLYLRLKEQVGNLMNITLDNPEKHGLRYECKICLHKNCPIQKAYLYWRRLVRWRPCNLEHC